MKKYSRRDMLALGAALAAGFGLPRRSALILAAGIDRIIHKHARVLWLQGMSCSGCSISLLNAEAPDAVQLLTEVISLVFHSNLSAAQGDLCLKAINDLILAGDYILVLEGAIPAGMPEACMIGSESINVLLAKAASRAIYVVSAGTCSSFGGLPAAEGNPVGAISLQQFMVDGGMGIDRRLVNCPGCPTNPHSMVAVLAMLAADQFPDVDEKLRTPHMFYGSSVHDECPRFHSWQKKEFAEKFGDEGCLFKLGCLGPLSRTDCPRRQWNGGVNWCIRAGAPCIACTSPEFTRYRSFPFYRQCEKHRQVSYNEASRGGESK